MPNRPARRIAALALAAALPFALAACSSSTPGSGPTTSSSAPTSTSASAPATSAPATSASPSASSAAANAAFGSACSQIPDTGNGSLTGMATAPVATAAAANPLLSTLTKAVKAAGLTDTLNNAPDITVFAPADPAFAKISKTDLTKLLVNRSKLAGILELHVISGRLSPADLAGTHKTLGGKSITITGSGENFEVNGQAKVVCGNIQTSNATVYVIDGVLMPK